MGKRSDQRFTRRWTTGPHVRANAKDSEGSSGMIRWDIRSRVFGNVKMYEREMRMWGMRGGDFIRTTTQRQSLSSAGSPLGLTCTTHQHPQPPAYDDEHRPK